LRSFWQSAPSYSSSVVAFGCFEGTRLSIGKSFCFLDFQFCSDSALRLLECVSVQELAGARAMFLMRSRVPLLSTCGFGAPDFIPTYG